MVTISSVDSAHTTSFFTPLWLKINLTAKETEVYAKDSVKNMWEELIIFYHNYPPFGIRMHKKILKIVNPFPGRKLKNNRFRSNIKVKNCIIIINTIT